MWLAATRRPWQPSGHERLPGHGLLLTEHGDIVFLVVVEGANRLKCAPWPTRLDLNARCQHGTIVALAVGDYPPVPRRRQRVPVPAVCDSPDAGFGDIAGERYGAVSQTPMSIRQRGSASGTGSGPWAIAEAHGRDQQSTTGIVGSRTSKSTRSELMTVAP